MFDPTVFIKDALSVFIHMLCTKIGTSKIKNFQNLMGRKTLQ